MGLMNKIQKIQQAGLSVAKNGWNNFQKYSYATESDVVEAMDKVFTEHGILCFLTMEDTQIVMNGESPLTRVKVRFSLVDVDSGESRDFIFYGDGQDKGDKGMYKAVTGAQKYFFMKNFRISTGDDPERDAVEHSAPAKQAPAQPQEVLKKTSAFLKPVSNGAAKAAPVAVSIPADSGEWT